MAPSDKTVRASPQFGRTLLTVQQKETSSDVACTHCRERKIRCDKERPRCSNCQRDDADCEYQVPGKRVNHVKLLCNNVVGLEDRLISMERQLSRLVTSLDFHRQSARSSGIAVSPTSVSSSDSSNHDNTSNGRSTEIYVGPQSLDELCTHLERSPLLLSSGDGTQLGNSETRTSLAYLVEQMREAALSSHSLPHGSMSNIPAKEHVQKASTAFFRHADLFTDIFLQDNFSANFDRIYANGAALSENDEPWIVCFKAIVLLVLGKEVLGTRNDYAFSGLAGSLLLPSASSLASSRLMTTPRLVNIQALMLLSIVAQQQDAQQWSDQLLASACTLAKRLGLHDMQPTPSGFVDDETRERWIIFRALYVRDKTLAMSCGTTSWLPELDIKRMLSFSCQKTPYSARLELARLQDKVYKLSKSRKYPRDSKRLHVHLERIHQELLSFAITHSVFQYDASCDPDRVALRLDFLTTRIAAFQHSPNSLHREVALADAKMSCLVLLIAHGECQSMVLEHYEDLQSTSGLVDADYARARRRRSRECATSLRSPNYECKPEEGHLRLLESFSPSAFFILVQEAVASQSSDTAASQQTIDLLRKTYTCFLKNSPILPAGNHKRKLENIFGLLLRAVDLLCTSDDSSHVPQQQQPPAPPAPMIQNQAGSLSTPQLDDFSSISVSHSMDLDLSSLPAWPTPSTVTQEFPWDSWSGDLSKNSEFGHSQFFGSLNGANQVFDGHPASMPPRFSPWMSQADQPVSRRKRARTDDVHADNSHGGTGFSLLGDLLSSSPRSSGFPFATTS